MLAGNVVSKTDHTGKVTEYSYDGMNRLTEELQKENGTLVQSYAYTFDDFNNRASLTATGEDAYTVAYSYDANNRLLEDVKTSAAETTKTLYFYDPNGNQIGRSMETQKTSANSESVSATDKVVSYKKSWYNGFKITRKVHYVGRTNDYARRYAQRSRYVLGIPMSQHPILGSTNRDMMPVATGLTQLQARVMENYLILAYTLVALDNARREIAKEKWPKALEEFNRAYDLTSDITSGLSNPINFAISLLK